MLVAISGGAGFLGLHLARRLAADGYRVALLARRLDRITALADDLGNGSIAIQADVTDRDSIVAAAERVRQELGGADVLVNNAGIMLLGPFDSNQRDDYRQMLEVNLLGAITATEVFLDQLKDGGGDIINISSVAGRTARAGNGVYAATKWGLNGWSESLRQELLPDVRVTLIEPGAVATELPTHITHEATRQGAEQLYSQVTVTAEDIAEVIAFAVNRPSTSPSTRSSSAPPTKSSDTPTRRDRGQVSALWPLCAARAPPRKCTQTEKVLVSELNTVTAIQTPRTTSLTVKCSLGLCGRMKGRA